MKWNKRGLVYAPSGSLWWAKEYATVPTVEVMGDTLRVYFASLDDNRYGRIGIVDLDARDPSRTLHEYTEPALDIGEPGTFDDCGVNPSCVVPNFDTKYLYYFGWQRCERVPYMLFVGVATSTNGTKFVRRFPTPLLDRTRQEPFLRSSFIALGRLSWWTSGIGWTIVNGKQYPTYVIRDDIGVCIDLEGDEFGLGRPWVVKDGDLYRMWYSIRSRSRPYHMGYAESPDGHRWTRKDNEVGIETSPDGWDSEMICYPCVVDAEGKRYMFHCGNQHGRSGFGYAVLE